MLTCLSVGIGLVAGFAVAIYLVNRGVEDVLRNRR